MIKFLDSKDTILVALLSILLCACQSSKVVTKIVQVDVQNVKPKNIILFIGDGMGISQVTALHYNNNMASSFARFPVVGLQTTYSADNLVTDSAASGTAMACGEKTKNSMIGLDIKGNPVESIMDIAKQKGMATGIVVTSSIVDATPAAFYAHQRSRGFNEQIASDLVRKEIDYVVGGGKGYFVDRKSDDRNLIKELSKKSYIVHDYNSCALKNYGLDSTNNYIYFTAYDEPLEVTEGRTYFKKACLNAISFLENHSSKGYLLVVEGSQIDWAGHRKDELYLMEELKDFDATIDSVFNYAFNDAETLVLVTADHETGGLSIDRGNPSGKVQLKFNSKKHSGTMIPVFAMGPGSEIFGGVYDNTEIFHKMKTLVESYQGRNPR